MNSMPFYYSSYEQTGKFSIAYCLTSKLQILYDLFVYFLLKKVKRLILKIYHAGGKLPRSRC